MNLTRNVVLFFLGATFLILCALAIFALPPMLMWVAQLDKSMVVGTINLLVIVGLGALFLIFMFSKANSFFGRMFKIFGVMVFPILFLGWAPSITMSITKVIYGSGSVGI